MRLASVLAALVSVTYAQSATTGCNTFTTCFPKTTFICTNANVDVRVYASAKLQKVFVRSNRVFDVPGVQEVATVDMIGRDSYTLKLTPDIRKQFDKAILYPKGLFELDASTSYGSTASCQRREGRHLDD